MPTDGPPLPDPKARTLARGPRRYRRKVASPKQWQAIQSAKLAPCRVCAQYGASNGHIHGNIHLHHVVSRWGTTKAEAVKAAQKWIRAANGFREPSNELYATEDGEIIPGESVRVLRQP